MEIDHPHQWFGGRTYSQHGEDLVLLNVFKRLGIDRPSYLDVGAHHPFDLSNTALLYKRGSRGVNVEANPNLIDMFMRERPDDSNINLAVVGNSVNAIELYMASETSGINSTVRHAMNAHGIAKTIHVPAATIDWVVDRHCLGGWPHICSIDVEGREMEILRSISRVRELPAVFVVEAVSGAGDITQELRKFFADIGYFVLCWCGFNMIFVKDRLRAKLC